MKFGKTFMTRLYIAFTLAPLALFIATYAIGLNDWASRSVVFDHCDYGLKEFLRATAATLNIVFILEVALTLFATIVGAFKGWRILLAIALCQGAGLIFLYKLAIPGNFELAWNESRIDCSSVFRISFRLAVAHIAACVSFGLSGIFGGVLPIAMIPFQKFKR